MANYPISALCGNFYPLHYNPMPVVKLIESLYLDPICLFPDAHKLGFDLSAAEDLGNEHPVALPVGPNKEIGAAGIGEALFRVKGDGTRIPFPGAQPHVFAMELTCRLVDSRHE
jgi:hypothetical protein